MVDSCWLYIYLVVCICYSQTPDLSLFGFKATQLYKYYIIEIEKYGIFQIGLFQSSKAPAFSYTMIIKEHLNNLAAHGTLLGTV